jgi:hypothetical protein
MADTDKAARIKAAIEKLKKPDKVGVAGVGLGTGAGIAGGSVAAGTLASAAGATTLLGSTSLASVLGGVFVTATPVGWVVGCGIAGGLAGYGIAKMIKSGAKQDQIRQELIKTLQSRLDAMQQQKELSQVSLRALKLALSEAMRRELIGAEQAERMVSLVEEQKLKIDVALERVRAINEVRQAKM